MKLRDLIRRNVALENQGDDFIDGEELIIPTDPPEGAEPEQDPEIVRYYHAEDD